MRKDLILRYLTDINSRMELLGKHLRGEVVDNSYSDAVMTTGEIPEAFTEQETEIYTFFLKLFQEKLDSLNKTVKFIEEQNF